jgi:hypothetical protein
MELEYNDYLKNLRDDDILEQQENLFKVGKVKSALESSFDDDIPNAIISHISRK